MQLSCYSYEINEDYLEYEFTSVGPKGSIKKIVRFAEINSVLFNIAFGDFNKETGALDDTVVTNNSDAYKVLMTVAVIIDDFLSLYPKASIIAMARTASRIRLYRIGISRHWGLITEKFEILGFENYFWKNFEFQQHYDAFLIQRK